MIQVDIARHPKYIIRDVRGRQQMVMLVRIEEKLYKIMKIH